MDLSSHASDKGAEPTSRLAKAVAGAGNAVKEALDPKTLAIRGILVGVPALAMCFASLVCVLRMESCMIAGIGSRTLSGLVIGIPIAPLVHLTSGQFWVDLVGWCSLSFGMTAHGPWFFVSAIGFLTVTSGCLTWLFGASGVLHVGSAGVLFGIFAFHCCILPFKRPLEWLDICSFIVFDLGFGGIWWGVNYNAHVSANAHSLLISGLLSGSALAWLHWRKFNGDCDAETRALSEISPLLASGIKATENVADAAASRGITTIGEASKAARRAAAGGSLREEAGDSIP